MPLTKAILDTVSEWQQSIFGAVNIEDKCSIAIAASKFAGLCGGVMFAAHGRLTLTDDELASVSGICAERLRIELDMLGVPEIFGDDEDD